MRSKFILAFAAVASFAILSMKTEFDLVPIGKNLPCLGVTNGPTPTAHVTVTRGTLNDTLVIEGANIKPRLGFDLFTVQRSNLLANVRLMQLSRISDLPGISRTCKPVPKYVQSDYQDHPALTRSLALIRT